MKQGNEIDKLFRDAVYDHETPVPEFVWEGIQEKQRSFGASVLHKLQQKWGLIALLTFLGLGCSYIGLSYAGSWNKTAALSDVNGIASPLASLSAGQGQLATNANAQKVDQQQYDEEHPSQLVSDNQNQITAVQKGKADPANKEQKSSNPINKRTTANSGQTVRLVQKKQGKIRNNDFRSQINSSSLTKGTVSNPAVKGSSLKLGNANEHALSASLQSNRSDSKQSAGSTSQEYGRKAAFASKRDLLSNKDDRNLANISKLASLQALSIASGKGFTQQKEQQFTKARANECFPELIKAKMLSLELFVSPDNVSRELLTYDPALQEHVEQRLNSEARRLSWSAGLRLDIAVHRNLHLKTGLGYAQINELFRHTGEEKTVTTTTIEETEVNGQIEIDTVYTVENWQRVVETGNRYRFFDVPLILSYEAKFGRLSLSANAGTVFNIFFTQTGRIFSPEESEPTPVDIRTDGESPFFRNFNAVSLYGGIGAYYKIADGVELMAEPHVKYMLEPLNKVSYSVEQRYQTVGINLGLRYKF